jgi:hypothetical protein
MILKNYYELTKLTIEPKNSKLNKFGTRKNNANNIFW